MSFAFVSIIHLQPVSTLGAYFSNRQWRDTRPSDITCLLHLSVGILGPAVECSPSDISALSLRAAGAMVLLCASIDSDHVAFLVDGAAMKYSNTPPSDTNGAVFCLPDGHPWRPFVRQQIKYAIVTICKDKRWSNILRVHSSTNGIAKSCLRCCSANDTTTDNTHCWSLWYYSGRYSVTLIWIEFIKGFWGVW